MSLPRTAVSRPVTTLMCYTALCLFGLFAFIMLPVDLMPNAGAGSLTVMIGVRGGLPPEDIESLVTKVVEEAVATSAHLRNVLSVSRKDRSTVTLTFEPGTDLSFAALEVQERLAKIRNKLPRDIEKPIVAHYSEGDYPVLILSLTSDKVTPEKLRELVDNRLKPQLSRVNGVANVEVGGGEGTEDPCGVLSRPVGGLPFVDSASDRHDREKQRQFAFRKNRHPARRMDRSHHGAIPNHRRT